MSFLSRAAPIQRDRTIRSGLGRFFWYYIPRGGFYFLKKIGTLTLISRLPLPEGRRPRVASRRCRGKRPPAEGPPRTSPSSPSPLKMRLREVRQREGGLRGGGGNEVELCLHLWTVVLPLRPPALGTKMLLEGGLLCAYLTRPLRGALGFWVPEFLMHMVQRSDVRVLLCNVIISPLSLRKPQTLCRSRHGNNVPLRRGCCQDLLAWCSGSSSLHLRTVSPVFAFAVLPVAFFRPNLRASNARSRAGILRRRLRVGVQTVYIRGDRCAGYFLFGRGFFFGSV